MHTSSSYILFLLIGLVAGCNSPNSSNNDDIEIVANNHNDDEPEKSLSNSHGAIAYEQNSLYQDGDRNEVRFIQNINRNWTFNYFPSGEENVIYIQPDFDDTSWPAIALPHTWQTYETTRELHPFIRNASEKDDPYWWYGWGVYRKHFSIDTAHKGKKIFVEFDGVQKYSKVYLNGHYLGDHKGGFTSFYIDLTEHINWEGDNLLAVAVSNRRNDAHRIPPMTAGNWNVYGGIYRDVHMLIKDRLYIPYQGSYKHEGGTFITTPRVTSEKAVVHIKTYVKNEYSEDKTCLLVSKILDPAGKLIKKLETQAEIRSGELYEFVQQAEDIEQPLLWSPEAPNLYKVISEVILDNQLVDDYESPLGFRWFHWDYEKDDLYVNGKKINILGTNRHQEYPWLGDAHPKWIADMDLRDIRYNLGHNFMRFTHYPNDPFVYDWTDKHGIIVVEEVPNIKNINFNEEVQEQNVREMIRRDRNHPSIFFWSMGNETSDAADSKWAVEEDTTRIIHLRKGEEGGNYVEHTHENLDMENLLRVTIRGWFDVEDAPKGFSSTPENGQYSGNETWQHQMARVRNGSIRGLLGNNCSAWLYEDHGADREYKNCILKYINPKGWVDMYRQPKYIYWLTRAHYTNHPTVYIHPHFWRTQYIDQRKDIVVDSNCEEVNLFVNGRLLRSSYPSQYSFFNTVTFEGVLVKKGTLKAVGKKNGKTYVHEVHMPGVPAQLALSTQQMEIPADRAGIAIVKADILDENGHPVFDASNTLHWEVEGPGKLVGPSIYESDIRKHEAIEGTGYTVVPTCNLIRSTNDPGTITVTVTAEGLASASIAITSVPSKALQDQWITEPTLSDEGRHPVRKDIMYAGSIPVIEELFQVRENLMIKGNSLEEYKHNLHRFINNQNHDYDDKSYGYQVLLDVLAKKLVQLNGELIADDYNFLINRYNEFRMLEKAINNQAIPDKQELIQNYANEIIQHGTSVDLKEELEKIKSIE